MYLITKCIYGINYIQTHIYILNKKRQKKKLGLLIIVAIIVLLEFYFVNSLIKEEKTKNRKRYVINNFNGMPL